MQQQTLDDNGQPWWRRRAKHGRGLLFSSPDLMWEAACEYFDDTDKGGYWKRREVAFDKNSASFMDKEYDVKVPFTWEGLCLYTGISLSYFRTFKTNYRKKLKEGINTEVEDNFLAVVEAIECVINKNWIEGSSVGAFNSNVGNRYVGLKDQQQLSGTNEDGESTSEIKVTLKLD